MAQRPRTGPLLRGLSWRSSDIILPPLLGPELDRQQLLLLGISWDEGQGFGVRVKGHSTLLYASALAPPTRD